MEINLPDNYSKLEDTLTTADKILTKAVDDSKTLFHTMVVSSFDGEKISSRVMVLREFDIKRKIMRFHTDYRAPKIQQLSKYPFAMKGNEILVELILAKTLLSEIMLYEIGELSFSIK